MYQLTNLTNKPKQLVVWTNENLEVEIYLEYIPNQFGWFFGVKYSDIVDYKNIRLTVHENILRSYSNLLPFGLMCVTDDGQEPTGIDDFASGYASIYMLTQQECKQLEDMYYA